MPYTTDNYATDEKTAEVVYNKHFRRYPHLKEDMKQNAIVDLWQARQRFETYSYEVALKSMLYFFRKEKNHLDFDVSLFEETAEDLLLIDTIPADPDPDMTDNELEQELKLQEKLRRKIDKLAGNAKKIIQMYLNRRSYEEIAKMVGMTKQSVGEYIQKFREAMARDLWVEIKVR